jgi:hypothetical protein
VAALDFSFLQSAVPGATLHCNAQLGGSWTSVVTGPGWEVRNKAAGQFCTLNGPFTTVPFASGLWTGTAQPPASAPDDSLGDAWRTAMPIFGTFANTDWTVVTFWRSNTTAQDFRGRMCYRLWKGSDPTGAGATELTSGTFVSNTTTASVATDTSTTLTATWSPGGTITFDGEFLFVQMALEVTTAGTVTTGSVRLVSAVTAKVTTPDFTPDSEAKVFYFKDAVPTGATNHRSLQDGGSVTAAMTTTGWNAGTNTAPNYCIQNGGSEIGRTNGQWTTTPEPQTANPSATVGDCWRSENAITGTFANKCWGFNFGMRSVTANYTGRYTIRVRVYKSSNQNGTSATELTSATIESPATRAGMVTNTTNVNPLVFDPGGTITFNNEYLFVQVALRITTTGTGTSTDMDFRVGSAEFMAIYAPKLASDITVTASLNDAGDTAASTFAAKDSATAALNDAGDTLAATATAKDSVTAALNDAGDTLAATVTVSTAETNATAALNDAADATAATLTARVAASVSAADATDTATATGAALIAATLAQTDVADALAATVTAAISATVAASDDADATSSNMTLRVSLSLAKMDDADSLVAHVSGPGITADLVDTADTTAAFLTARVSAAFQGTDANDSLTSSVILPLAIAAMNQDQADALNAGVEVSAIVQTNATDTADTLAAQLASVLSAQFNVTDQADTLAANLTTFDAGDLLTNPYFIAVSSQPQFGIASSQPQFSVASSQPQFSVASSAQQYIVG